MQARFHSVASARAEGEDAPIPLAGTASKLVLAICQVMVGEIRREVQAKLKLKSYDQHHEGS